MGAADGIWLGGFNWDGERVLLVGNTVGSLVGNAVGNTVGSLVGNAVGNVVGSLVGVAVPPTCVGATVAVGDPVTTGVGDSVTNVGDPVINVGAVVVVVGDPVTIISVGDPVGASVSSPGPMFGDSVPLVQIRTEPLRSNMQRVGFPSQSKLSLKQSSTTNSSLGNVDPTRVDKSINSSAENALIICEVNTPVIPLSLKSIA